MSKAKFILDFHPIGPLTAVWYRCPIWTNFGQDIWNQVRYIFYRGFSY